MCEVALPRIQPELLELLAKQLDRCGPANLVVPPCAACPAFPDKNLLFLLAGGIAGLCLGVALTLLWSLLTGSDARPAPSALPAPPLPAPAPGTLLAVAGASPAAFGRRRAAPGSSTATAAFRDLD
jgi:hypothetical protein